MGDYNSDSSLEIVLLGTENERPTDFPKQTTYCLVDMISLRTVKFLPLLVTLLAAAEETHEVDMAKEGPHTFRPCPAAKTSAAPFTFAEVLQMQKNYSYRQAHDLESIGKIELYEQWSAKIIEMMEIYGTRQKCQNCGRSHESEATAMQWIK
ncbi:hypothetical protein EG329_011981 [Mollisiaceae sp. DMI_Dod_QoI]|nr:hypothetical protein EG329_011981 [Helotiales sp. DMI_Dod_QoI]